MNGLILGKTWAYLTIGMHMIARLLYALLLRAILLMDIFCTFLLKEI